MTILACDPGLGTTAAVAYDPTRDAVLAAESWRFGPRAGMTDPERVFAYCAALREFLQAWAPVDVFAVEDQQAATIHSGASGGRSGGLAYDALPEAIRTHVGAGNGHHRELTLAEEARQSPWLVKPKWSRASERGGKNRSIVRLAKLAGALEQEAERLNIRVIRVQPREAKRALTGNPNAHKVLMQDCATQYGLTGRCGPSKCWPSDHIADSVGIALAARAILRREELRG